MKKTTIKTFTIELLECKIVQKFDPNDPRTSSSTNMFIKFQIYSNCTNTTNTKVIEHEFVSDSVWLSNNPHWNKQYEISLKTSLGDLNGIFLICQLMTKIKGEEGCGVMIGKCSIDLSKIPFLHLLPFQMSVELSGEKRDEKGSLNMGTIALNVTAKNFGIDIFQPPIPSSFEKGSSNKSQSRHFHTKKASFSSFLKRFSKFSDSEKFGKDILQYIVNNKESKLKNLLKKNEQHYFLEINLNRKLIYDDQIQQIQQSSSKSIEDNNKKNECVTPLFLAALLGNVSLIKVFLPKYKDLINIDEYCHGRTALQQVLLCLCIIREKIAKFNKTMSQNKQVLKEEKGFIDNSLNDKRKFMEIFKILILNGADINKRTKFANENKKFNSQNLLMIAINQDLLDHDIEELFFPQVVVQPATIDTINMEEESKQQEEKDNDDDEVEKLTEEKEMPIIDLSYLEDNYNSVLHFACKKGKQRIVKRILELNIQVGSKPDIYGNQEQIPLEKVKNNNDFDCLLLAAKYNTHCPILSLITERKTVFIDSIDGDGNTALHYCCMKKSDSSVKALLQNRCSIKIKNKEGKTADCYIGDDKNRFQNKEIKRLLGDYQRKEFDYIDLTGLKREIISRGSGGTSSIWKYFIDNKEYAVKLYDHFDKKTKDVQRIIDNEKNILYKMKDHKNIVKCLFYCPIKGKEGFVLEYCDGSLMDIDYSKIRLFNKFDVLEQILNGLSGLHKKDIVHLDLKPGNILVSNDKKSGNPTTVRLIDFGASKSLEKMTTSAFEMNNESEVFISLHYTCPEILQFTGGKKGEKAKFSGKSDIFSFGMIACELLLNKKDCLKSFVKGYERLSEEERIREKLKIIKNSKSINLFNVKDISNQYLKLVDMLNSCIKKDPKKRPNIIQLMKLLRECKKNAQNRIPFLRSSHIHYEHGGTFEVTCKICGKNFCEKCVKKYCSKCDMVFCKKCFKELIKQDGCKYDNRVFSFCLKCIKNNFK